MLEFFERMIAADEQSRLAGKGYKAADLHIHSWHSPDVPQSQLLSPKKLFNEGRRRGLDYVAITDHDNIDSIDDLGRGREGFVPGVEIKIRDNERIGHTIHVNVYLLEQRDFRELMAIATSDEPSLERFTAYCKDNDLPYTYNHPFWFEPGEIPNLRSVGPAIEEYFPVVEYNMHRVKIKNWLAVALARHYARGVICNTDTHIGDVGRVRTLARGETFRKFFASVAAGEAYLVTSDLTRKNLADEARLYLELFRSLTPRKVFEFLRVGALKNYPGLMKLIHKIYDNVTGGMAPGFVGKVLYDPKPYALFLWMYVWLENLHGQRMGAQLEISLPSGS